MHSLWLVIHVLGWVFWLGTDLGVFIAAKYSEKSELSVETRLTVLKVGLTLDMLPRICVPIVFMTGVVLTAGLGIEAFLPVPLAILFGTVWLLAVIIGIKTEGGQGALGALAMRTQFVCNIIIAVYMGGFAMAAIFGFYSMPLWLALKWLAYSVIAIAAIVLEVTFKPAIALYGKLAVDGASSTLDSALTKSLKPVYICVLVIYAATLVAGISGIVKV